MSVTSESVFRQFVFVVRAIAVLSALTAMGRTTNAQRINVDGIGVTEWEEWSFANKDWWAGVAGDQTRSQFTLGQGVVAIADPDEWDDRGNPAAAYTFNSQLLSPTWNVPTSGSLSLEFASSWRPEGFQTASLDVIYDGVVTEIFRWGSENGTSIFGSELFLPVQVEYAAITSLGGDFDGDGDVDGRDFLSWQRGPRSAAEFGQWAARFGSVGAAASAVATPEPACAWLGGLGVAAALAMRSRRC